MGCDIHCFVEKKIKGKWMEADGWVKMKDGTIKVPYPAEFYNCRNYDLFGLLAKVRTEHPFSLEPKGFPEDASFNVRKEFEEWGESAHTPSWLTLDELTKLEEELKEKKVLISGMKDGRELKKLKKSLESKNPDYDLLYPYCSLTDDKKSVQFEVEIPAVYLFKEFFEKVYWLSSYDHCCNHDEIRIVFWFDN